MLFYCNMYTQVMRNLIDKKEMHTVTFSHFFENNNKFIYSVNIVIFCVLIEQRILLTSHM